MRGGDNHRYPPRDALQGQVGQHLALMIAEHELLREVGQDAQAVRTRVDHEIEAAPLALEVQLATVVERGGHHREHALEPRCHRLAHANLPRVIARLTPTVRIAAQPRLLSTYPFSPPPPRLLSVVITRNRRTA